MDAEYFGGGGGNRTHDEGLIPEHRQGPANAEAGTEAVRPRLSALKRGTLSGQCGSGAEAGRGYRAHLVPFLNFDHSLSGVALCGAKPGRRSAVGWTHPGLGATPCPRCYRKASRSGFSIAEDARP